MLAVDHLMMGVADFGRSVARWRSEYGLSAVEGIRFEDAPAWGNWAVPLGETWIELVGIVDSDAARNDPRAEFFSRLVAAGDRLLGWALAPEDLDGVAERLGLPVIVQSATDVRSGERFTWRQVGFEETRAERYLPFFIGWDQDLHARMRAATGESGNPHAGQSDTRLELSGDPRRLAGWLADLDPPISITPGPADLTARISTSSRELVLR